MKFIVDSMFGKLARFLRLFGYDALYSNEFEDDEILKIAKEQNRILLTKDKILTQRAEKNGIDTLYINKKNIAERIALIKQKYDIKLTIIPNSRCPLCNSEIEKIEDKELIKNEVFPSTFKNFNDFWKCTNCSKIYYIGEHWKKFEDLLKEVYQNMKDI
ncbi:MAG: hypothetical protein EAX96_05370 [Candidatus Lokiarchaeota archaeon]|nr:hypothetical protein [Candidatus Lokiarchaeota archaeon]